MTRKEWEDWKERNGDWWDPIACLIMFAIFWGPPAVVVCLLVKVLSS